MPANDDRAGSGQANDQSVDPLVAFLGGVNMTYGILHLELPPMDTAILTFESSLVLINSIGHSAYENV